MREAIKHFVKVGVLIERDTRKSEEKGENWIAKLVSIGLLKRKKASIPKEE